MRPLAGSPEGAYGRRYNNITYHILSLSYLTSSVPAREPSFLVPLKELQLTERERETHA